MKKVQLGRNVSKNFAVKFVWAAGVLALGVSTLNYSTRAFAGEGTEEPGKVEGSAARDALKDFLKTEDTARVDDFARKLKMSSSDLKGFFAEEKQAGRLTSSNEKAWSDLLATTSPKAASPSAKDFSSADVNAENLGNYLRLRQSKVADNFEIRESQLAKISENWTLEQRMHFGSVLRHAVELVKSGQFATIQDAFDKALEESPYGKNAKSCKI